MNEKWWWHYRTNPFRKKWSSSVHEGMRPFLFPSKPQLSSVSEEYRLRSGSSKRYVPTSMIGKWAICNEHGRKWVEVGVWERRATAEQESFVLWLGYETEVYPFLLVSVHFHISTGRKQGKVGKLPALNSFTGCLSKLVEGVGTRWSIRTFFAI